MVSNKCPEVIIGCGHLTQAVVLGELLYATETWPAKQKDIRRLECFHHHCLRSILGISRVQQCVQHNSNEEVRKQFDMQTPLAVMITCRRLQWLGHVTRMDDVHLLSIYCLVDYLTHVLHMESS